MKAPKLTEDSFVSFRCDETTEKAVLSDWLHMCTDGNPDQDKMDRHCHRLIRKMLALRGKPVPERGSFHDDALLMCASLTARDQLLIWNRLRTIRKGFYAK